MKLKIIAIFSVFFLLFCGLAWGQGFQRSVTHHYIHAGNFFTFSNLWTSVSDTTSKYILIRTGDRMAHFHTGVGTGGQAEIRFYNGTTVTNNGTQINAINHNRVSDRLSKTKIYKGPTVSSTDSLILVQLVPGSSSAASVSGGTSGGCKEFVLEKNSVYLVNATNTSGSSIKMNIVGSFYEMNLN